MPSQSPAAPLENLSMEAITDWTMRQNIQRLQHALPWASILQCRDALLTASGDVDNATAFLLRSKPEPTQDACPICKEDYNNSEDPQEPRILHCGHIFCQRCISEWLDASENLDCPLCRSSQLYFKCHHLFDPRPLNDHPPIQASRSLPETCIDCTIANFSQERWNEIAAADAIHQEEERRIRDERLAIWSKPEILPGILQPGLGKRLEELDREESAAWGALFTRLKKKMMEDRW